MNRFFSATAISLALVTLFSCNSGNEPAYDPTIATPQKGKDSASAAMANTPIVTDSMLMAQPATATAATAAAPVAAGMNPAHGQPGHRCDIAVGAPLNSPAAKTAAPATTTQTITPTAAPTAAPTKTAPGMNPAHGQPGHRCDIAVGAPLNSAPAKPAGATAPATPAATAPAETAPAAEADKKP